MLPTTANIVLNNGCRVISAFTVSQSGGISSSIFASALTKAGHFTSGSG